MSEFLATDRLDGEAPTVEGRLADIIEMDGGAIVQISEYKLSDSDRTAVVKALRAAASRCEVQSAGLPFQKRVVEWLMACFSMEVCRDGIERNHRFLEEAIELVQSLDCTRSEAHQLVDYVFDRPVGEPMQELGGTLVTLTALANCHDMDMMQAGEIELARVWTKIDKIRAKQAAKPKHSPLPQHVPVAQGSWNDAIEAAAKRAEAEPHDASEHDAITISRCIALGIRALAVPSAQAPAQAVQDPWANAIDPDARTPGDDLGPSELIRVELRQAMLDCWNSICADTDCHPLDIKHQGKKLFFMPDHWADMVAWELSCRLSHHVSMRDLISSGGLPEASAVPSADREAGK